MVDGQAVFSEEIVWEPTGQTDPNYHYDHIVPCEAGAGDDAQAGRYRRQSAGVFVDNRPMVASLFRGSRGVTARFATCSCASGPSSACRWRW